MDSIVSELTWIDWTALAVLAYFLVSGLFHGFLWQMSRLLSFVLAYVLAGVFARDVAALLERSFGGLEGVSIYLAYFVIFLVVLIALSIVARVLDRFVKELDLSFYNHLGGGLLGAATAAALLVAVLGILYRVLPDSGVVAQAKQSHTGRLARYLVDRAGLPEEIRRLYHREAEQGTPREEPEKGK